MLELEPFHCISNTINAFGKNVMQELNLKSFKVQFYLVFVIAIHPSIASHHVLESGGIFLFVSSPPPFFFLIFCKDLM